MPGKFWRYLRRKVSIKVALPKGRYLAETADLLRRAGWGLSGYHETTRLYHLESEKFPDLSAKMFHEKDIPIQVAVGNYDLGICGLDWTEELLVKFPSSALIKVKNLGYGEGGLYIAASQFERISTVEELQEKHEIIRIASEYPNLAESFAMNFRLKRFSIFPLWGAAETYPPESAELVLVAGRIKGELLSYGLVSLKNILNFSAFLIANRSSWESKNMNKILVSIRNELAAGKKHPSSMVETEATKITSQYLSQCSEKLKISEESDENIVRLALPDGHQQVPTIQLLNKAGIQVYDYPSETGNRRPTTNLDRVTIKVIRPQDMPLQVANDNFDLAITGRDWLAEHLYQFPSSPVTELVDLKYGRVRIVAVVSKELPVDDIYTLKQFNAECPVPIRVASEYVNIADKFARDNHLGMYRVVPTWGASEAFLPGDADLLIENTQTGRTLTRHNLKIIDTLFVSTACLIGRKDAVVSSVKGERIRSIIEALQSAMEDSQY